MIADITQGDILDALANLAGIAIDAVDGVKTVGKITTFLLKNADNVGVYSSVIRFINKNCPDLMKYLGKTEGFLEVSKKISLVKDWKITKIEYDEIVKSWAKAGIENLFESEGETESDSDRDSASIQLTAGKNVKSHYKDHKGLLEAVLNKEYPKFKDSNNAEEFLMI